MLARCFWLETINEECIDIADRCSMKGLAKAAFRCQQRRASMAQYTANLKLDTSVLPFHGAEMGKIVAAPVATEPHLLDDMADAWVESEI
jgi:hypothetical protein